MANSDKFEPGPNLFGQGDDWFSPSLTYVDPAIPLLPLETAAAITDTTPPPDTWPHWGDDEVEYSIVPVVQFQDEPLPTLPEEAPHFEDHPVDDEWWRDIDSSPVGADVVIADQPVDEVPIHEEADDDWWHALAGEPVQHEEPQEAGLWIDDDVDDDWARVEFDPVGPDAALPDQPPDDAWPHWADDDVDLVPVPVVVFQDDVAPEPAPPQEALPEVELHDDEDWVLALDAAPVGEDSPQADQQPPAPALDEDDGDDDWWQLLDASPASTVDVPAEDAPWSEDEVDDSWSDGIESGPALADVAPEPDVPPEDTWDHWAPDGWDHIAIIGSALQSDGAAAEEPGQPDAPWPADVLDDDWAELLDASPVGADAPAAEDTAQESPVWDYENDESAALFDWMVVGEAIIEEDPRPEELFWVEDDQGDDWAAAIDAAPVGEDAPAAQEPGQPDAPAPEDVLDDDWAELLDPSPVGADAPPAEPPLVSDPWPYEQDEDAGLADWMVVGEPVIEEDPRPEEAIWPEEPADDPWPLALDAAPVGADAPPAEEPGQPDAPWQEEVYDEMWAELLDAAPADELMLPPPYEYLARRAPRDWTAHGEPREWVAVRPPRDWTTRGNK